MLTGVGVYVGGALGLCKKKKKKIQHREAEDN